METPKQPIPEEQRETKIEKGKANMIHKLLDRAIESLQEEAKERIKEAAKVADMKEYTDIGLIYDLSRTVVKKIEATMPMRHASEEYLSAAANANILTPQYEVWADFTGEWHMPAGVRDQGWVNLQDIHKRASVGDVGMFGGQGPRIDWDTIREKETETDE